MVLTVLELKGMQAGQKAASQMLEAVYATYLLVWMHGGDLYRRLGARPRGRLSERRDTFARGQTGSALIGKLLARCLAIVLLIQQGFCCRRAFGPFGRTS